MTIPPRQVSRAARVAVISAAYGICQIVRIAAIKVAMGAMIFAQIQRTSYALFEISMCASFLLSVVNFADVYQLDDGFFCVLLYIVDKFIRLKFFFFRILADDIDQLLLF